MSEFRTLSERLERVTRRIGETMESLLDSVRAEGFPDATVEDLVFYFHQYCQSVPNSGESGLGANSPAGKVGARSAGGGRGGAAIADAAGGRSEADLAPAVTVEAAPHSANQGPDRLPFVGGMGTVPVTPRKGRPLLTRDELELLLLDEAPPPSIRQGIADIAATFKTEPFSVGQLCHLVGMRYPTFKHNSIRRTFQEMAPHAFVRIRWGLYRNAPAGDDEAAVTTVVRADRPSP